MALFFGGIGIVGMLFMALFAYAFDGADVKKNRIEEITNSLSQTAVFIVILIFMNAV